MDEFDEIVLRDFLGDNWSAFVGFCEERGADANDIYVKLGGERE